MNHCRILLAPLEGVTDRTYRSCFYKHFPGLSASLTPFLPIPDRVKRVPQRNLKDVCLPAETSVPEIPQLLVSEKEAFLIAVRALEKRGFTEVNWNLGCPSKGVVRKGKGSGMLPHTNHILKVLDGVLSHTTLKVSLKLRLGLHDSKELFCLLPALKNYPLNGIILHPRLGSQMYRGSVDLDGFARALDLYEKPICYNGDINSLSDFVLLQNRFPEVNEWMIGRGLLADPFLLGDILNLNDRSGNWERDVRTLPFSNKSFELFLDDLLEQMKKKFQREKPLWNYMKGILIYSFSLPGVSETLRTELKKINNEADWFNLKDRVFNQN